MDFLNVECCFFNVLVSYQLLRCDFHKTFFFAFFQYVEVPFIILDFCDILLRLVYIHQRHNLLKNEPEENMLLFR